MIHIPAGPDPLPDGFHQDETTDQDLQEGALDLHMVDDVSALLSNEPAKNPLHILVALLLRPNVKDYLLQTACDMIDLALLLDDPCHRLVKRDREATEQGLELHRGETSAEMHTTTTTGDGGRHLLELCHLDRHLEQPPDDHPHLYTPIASA
jgi:hypothetical protein